MRSLVDHLSSYAHYHRDSRNIMTHFVGIPMIVFAVAMLLSRPILFELSGLAVTPSLLLVVACSVFYCRLDLRLGSAMSALLLLCLYGAYTLSLLPTVLWLSISVSLFVIGWGFQFVGHYFEGKKPAFVDDIIGLIIGPLFILVELLFAFGCLKALQRQIVQQAGEVRHS